MRRGGKVYALSLALALLLSCLRAGKQTPLWKIDLSPYGYKPAEDVMLRFSGRFLVIYFSRRSNSSRVVFDKETHQQIPENLLAGVALPPPIDFEAKFERKPSRAVNIIARRKQMSIEHIGGVGIGEIPDAEFYLQEPGKPRVLLLRGSARVTLEIRNLWATTIFLSLHATEKILSWTSWAEKSITCQHSLTRM